MATKRDNWQGGRGGGGGGGGGGGRGGSSRGRGGYGGYQMDDPVSDDPSDVGFYGGPRGINYILLFFKMLTFLTNKISIFRWQRWWKRSW